MEKLVRDFRKQVRPRAFKFCFPPLQNPLGLSWVTGDAPAFGTTNSWRLLTGVMAQQDVLQDDLRRLGSSKTITASDVLSVLKDQLKLCRMALAS